MSGQPLRRAATPRVDAAAFVAQPPGQPAQACVTAEVARALEVELALAQSVIRGEITIAQMNAALGRAVAAEAPAAKPVAPANAASAAQPPSPDAVLYPQGHVLFRKGDAALVLWIIQQGTVEIVDETDGRVLGHLQDGAVLGEQALMEGGVRGVTARAATPLRCREIRADELHSALVGAAGPDQPPLGGGARDAGRPAGDLSQDEDCNWGVREQNRRARVRRRAPGLQHV